MYNHCSLSDIHPLLPRPVAGLFLSARRPLTASLPPVPLRCGRHNQTSFKPV
uniref:Uncharacterized protein n=1 Tax=Myoviridae sp. ct8Uw4 TaxID=2825040 RepID=A0A8S5P136_9CAUD|nr:MAG TPA: hypothetical protein [Myoviridae sp. ct8Uw4]